LNIGLASPGDPSLRSVSVDVSVYKTLIY
jgi:hypothetical protein